MNDILRLLRNDEIHAMIDRFARDLPNSVLGYNFLCMYMKWQRIIGGDDSPPRNTSGGSEFGGKLNSDTVWRKLYTKRDGVADNCTFVSISGDRDLNIFMFSYAPHELKECIEHTKLINWALGPAFSGFDGKHSQNIFDIIRDKRLTLEYVIPSDGYYLPRDAALQFTIDVPEDVQIGGIRDTDYNIVINSWTYCYPGSDTYMKCLILLNENIAIYSKDTDEIKSWAIIDEIFSVAMLHTKSEYTRNGYASLVIKTLARILAEKHNLGTFCFITHGNTNSERCFSKLGFRKVDFPEDLIWVKVVRSD